jgi:hypothetical protein
MRDRQGSLGLDEDSLGRLEEDVKSLGILLRMASPLVRAYALLEYFFKSIEIVYSF